MSKYGSWTIDQLKTELKSRNARLSGRKKELIERLESYDRNNNFGRCEALGSDFKMILPAELEYSDLHSEKKFPQTKMENVANYLEPFEKQVEKVSVDMYKEKFLIYVRIANTNNQYFVRSACHAEMTKCVTYKIDISFNADGFVIESQCECAAGMGPNAHCKHVCCLLYAMCDFSKRAVVIVEKTCTEKLQSFHQAKKFKGSPVKARDLQMDGANESSNIFFDPRPEAMRNIPGYREYFRNICLSTSGISQLPIFQTFLPANTLAVAHDHNYFAQTHENNFLSLANIIVIDPDTISAIEEKTRDQRKSHLWFQERIKRLSSSNFGRICKSTERTDKKKLAVELLKPALKIRTPPILHGQKYEGVALKKYENLASCTVTKCGLYVSGVYPYICASPDGITNENRLVEVKCPYTARNMDISDKSVPFLKVNDTGSLTLDAKHNYYYQIQGQLFCANKSQCDLVVYTFRDVFMLRIERDNEFINDMVDKLKSFFVDHFQDALLDKFYYQSYKGLVNVYRS